MFIWTGRTPKFHSKNKQHISFRGNTTLRTRVGYPLTAIAKMPPPREMSLCNDSEKSFLNLTLEQDIA